MIISQSLMKDCSPYDVCPLYLKYRYVDKLPQSNEDEINAMFRGRYFEWHLLGATRDGVEPKFNALSKASKKPDGNTDTRPQAQYEIDQLVSYARDMLRAFGLNTRQGDKQVKLVHENMQGHIDWITHDIGKAGKDNLCLIDVKYTETKIDDRWQGFADWESREDLKLQAAHYITLYYLITGKMLPFYYFVFGKSQWAKVFSVTLTKNGVDWHEEKVRETEDKWNVMALLDFAAKPEFNKCNACGYNHICPCRSLVPIIEQVEI